MNDLPHAEDLFSIVWFGDTKDIIMRADAGHLLGVIYRQKGKSSWNIEAEDILRAALDIIKKNINHQTKEHLQLKSRILNSLGATLLQTSELFDQAEALKKLEEAEVILYESFELEQDILEDKQGTAQVLNTLATLYLRLYLYSGEEAFVYRALEFIDKALEWSSQDSDDIDLVYHLNTKADILIARKSNNDLDEAERLLNQCIEVNKKIRDKKTQAIAYYRMAKVFLGRGDEESIKKSITWASHSIGVWDKLDNAIGKRDSMELIANGYDLLNEPSKASYWRRKAYNSNA